MNDSKDAELMTMRFLLQQAHRRCDQLEEGLRQISKMNVFERIIRSHAVALRTLFKGD